MTLKIEEMKSFSKGGGGEPKVRCSSPGRGSEHWSERPERLWVSKCNWKFLELRAI